MPTTQRKGNRSLQLNRKGFKPSIRSGRYTFQLYDLVKFQGKIYNVKGVFNFGKGVRLSDAKGKRVTISIKNVQLVKYGKGFLVMFKQIT